MGSVRRECTAMTWTYKFFSAWIPGDGTAEMCTNSGQRLDITIRLDDVDHRLTGRLPPTISLLEFKCEANGRLHVGKICD